MLFTFTILLLTLLITSTARASPKSDPQQPLEALSDQLNSINLDSPIVHFKSPNRIDINSLLKQTSGYKEIKHADFPAKFDYNCKNSKADWGCVFSVKSIFWGGGGFFFCLTEFFSILIKNSKIPIPKKMVTSA